MQELSLNILDVAQNSVTAGASLIEIGLDVWGENGRMMTITIKDNGKGMDEETLDIILRVLEYRLPQPLQFGNLAPAGVINNHLLPPPGRTSFFR